MQEILVITNPVISEPTLPDFSFAAKDGSESMRVSAFDELKRMFERHIWCGSEQKVNMLRHQDEGVQLITAFAAISVKSLQEKADIVFDNKESPTLPGRESYEIGSGRGDESSKLQEQTSAAKAAIFAKPKSARVELVPFPVDFVAKRSRFGNNGLEFEPVDAGPIPPRPRKH
jgi:hypothetical protein